jgi:hypothetical protein
MFGTRIPGSRAFAALALGALVLTGCGGDSVESYEDAEENYLVGCLEPIDGQPAQFVDGEVQDEELHGNFDECKAMWDAIQDELSFVDFKLVSKAIDDEPNLLTLDPVPTDLVNEEDQARLEDAVAVLQDVADLQPTTEGNA